MDRSFLALHNKNFFTATEIFNLRTIFEKEQSYAAFLTENQWASRYYPSIQPNKVAKSKMGVIGLLLFPINILIYLIYTLSRVLKKRSLSPLLDIRLKFDKDHYINLLRRGSEGGGHESAILTQFEYTLKNKFPTYYRASIIRFLFPSQTQITQEQALLKREEFKKYIIYQQ